MYWVSLQGYSHIHKTADSTVNQTAWGLGGLMILISVMFALTVSALCVCEWYVQQAKRVIICHFNDMFVIKHFIMHTSLELHPFGLVYCVRDVWKIAVCLDSFKWCSRTYLVVWCSEWKTTGCFSYLWTVLTTSVTHLWNKVWLPCAYKYSWHAASRTVNMIQKEEMLI